MIPNYIWLGALAIMSIAVIYFIKKYREDKVFTALMEAIKTQDKSLSDNMAAEDIVRRERDEWQEMQDNRIINVRFGKSLGEVISQDEWLEMQGLKKPETKALERNTTVTQKQKPKYKKGNKGVKK